MYITVETGSQAHTAIKRIILSAYFQSLCINNLYSAHTLVTRVKFVDWCSQVMKMARAEAPCAFQATVDGQLPDKQMRKTYT